MSSDFFNMLFVFHVVKSDLPSTKFKSMLKVLKPQQQKLTFTFNQIFADTVCFTMITTLEITCVKHALKRSSNEYPQFMSKRKIYIVINFN